jgi:cysteine desulfurase / selenocysteine lyase
MSLTESHLERLPFPAEKYRADFPTLHQKIYRQRDLIYLDNASSTQHPVSVIEAMNQCYRENYANVHRGIYWLSERASAQFEEARRLVQAFINSPHDNQVIFTSGTTAGINLVARSWGAANLKPDDEILLTIFEHHSNIVPWQQIAAQTGARVVFAGITPDGELDLDDLKTKLSSRTQVISVAAISNVLGNRVPIALLAAMARSVGAVLVVDAAQFTPHEKTDVQAWDADFVVFSGHKMLGPSGIGVLWGKQELLEAMPPFMGGGGMIERVTTDGFSAGELPGKFEAGTPPIVEAIGLGAAVRYLNEVSLVELSLYEAFLARVTMEGMSEISGLRILGPPADRRAGIVSFVVEGVSPQDLAILLDRKGIAVRVGHHCTMPLHEYLGIGASCRASFYLYNSVEEIQTFLLELRLAIARL